MKMEEAKKLIETGTIKEIQTAIDNNELDVDGTIAITTIKIVVDKGPYSPHWFLLPYICYAMTVGRPDVLKVFLDNNANVNIKTDVEGAVEVVPLRFATGGYYFCKDLLSPESFNFILKNMNKYTKEYITLLSAYGANFGDIKGHDTVFMEAAHNPNPVAFETTIKEAKKRLPPKKFLTLLKYGHPEYLSGELNAYLDSLDDKRHAYWEKEGPGLIKELKLKAAEEDEELKKVTLKAIAEKALNKTKKIAQKVKTALHTKEQKTK